MIFHPSVIALLVMTALVCAMFLYASRYAYQILKSWDLSSGSEAQLALERKTYLVSTMVAYTCAFQLLSLFLYVFVAEDLHTFFVGAMCAAGSLNMNAYGYPALVHKVANFMAAGTWLAMNYVDNRAEDYPLIRPKYALILVVTVSVLYETSGVVNYFLHLKGDVITSCCGTIFGGSARSVGTTVASFPVKTVEALFAASMAATFASGLRLYMTNRGPYVFSALAASTFVIAVVSIITFISSYIYELPTHHCPFCVLQAEYHYVGYLLYASLLTASVLGVAVGVIAPFRCRESLKAVIPPVQRRMALVALIALGVFVATVAWKMVMTDFVLAP